MTDLEVFLRRWVEAEEDLCQRAAKVKTLSAEGRARVEGIEVCVMFVKELLETHGEGAAG